MNTVFTQYYDVLEREMLTEKGIAMACWNRAIQECLLLLAEHHTLTHDVVAALRALKTTLPEVH